MTTIEDPARVELHHPDGSTSPLLIVETDQRDERRPSVLVLPGIAVGARYYLPLARALAAEGVDVAITELRGQGESTYRIGRRSAPAGYHESAAEDVPLALDAMDRRLGRRPVILLGHSMGAQIGVYHLARHDPRVAGLVAVAAQSPFHRGFPGPVGRKLRAGSVILPALGWLSGHVPGQFFGAKGRIPADRIRDWARLAAAGVMQPARADLDYPAGLSRVTVPALAVVIADDPLAPASAARNLLAMLPSARTTLELEPEALGHNSWARRPAEVVARVLAWTDREVVRPERDDDEVVDA
ncbi:alpha/beta fold hydrolase [Dietzia cinnamea]|uniref:alpha/beta fold hydrolase n=1 Tax=Dietzia cinnamea TaxID=321318 RepID=UPI0021A6DF4A|nr:alpha/beta fold hydrolase [Dietzia cinnamea]MCT2119631.1 alpha/beta fold hydrolase [Dietzia cinnamea]MCT2143620.1 alpha/beta fold hydrolase [Dietzia cinnamea]MCT2303461.1 alpha/beta fold hydrolase [Dietzia cinnamea]